MDENNDPIHMLHPLAKEVLQVQEVKQSNVHILTGFTKDVATLREEMTQKLATMLFFHSAESFLQSVKQQVGQQYDD